MEISEMTWEQVEERALEIKGLMEGNADELDLDALKRESEELLQRKNALIEERRIKMEEIANDKSSEEIVERDNGKMAKTLNEVLESREYMNAYEKWVRSSCKDDVEVRSLLTELVSGGDVPVPSYLEDKITTAWDNAGIISRAKKSYIKGIIRQGFELSATGADVHEEGDMENLPDEEELHIGVVSITPETIKKWITISDEAMDLTGEAFLDYIYDEIEYRIVAKAESEIVTYLLGLPTTATASSVNKIAYTPAQGETLVQSIILAQANLPDEASKPILIMNKTTKAALKSLMTTDGYLYKDPFDGLEVVNNSGVANNKIIMLDASALRVNFPNRYGVSFIFDRYSLAEKDLVKIVGRLPIGFAVTATNRVVVIN